jgi:hypothetical protein
VSKRPRVYGSSLELAWRRKVEGWDWEVPDYDGHGVVVEDLGLVDREGGGTVGTYSLGNLFVV